jgi:protein AATF/BFR2
VTPASLLPSTRSAFRTSRNVHTKSVTELIQETLSDHTRAVARTRVRRGGVPIDAGDSMNHGLDVDGKPLEEVEVFDDADFYQQLLRDVIDGQTSNGKTEWRQPKTRTHFISIWGG